MAAREDIPLGHVVGEYYVTKADNQAWNVGDAIFWDGSANDFTNAGPATAQVGVAIQAVPIGTGHATGLIRLNGSY